MRISKPLKLNAGKLKNNGKKHIFFNSAEIEVLRIKEKAKKHNIQIEYQNVKVEKASICLIK